MREGNVLEQTIRRVTGLRSRWRVGVGTALLLLHANAAMALGLGEIELDSALNEKLRAEIDLIDASGLERGEILVSLASADDFERVGVERFFFLTDLKFEIATDSRNNPVIRVRSNKAVAEPYLNFIVEVLWPSGRLLKEYTLLLDPPTFTQAAAPSVAAPSRQTASAPAPRQRTQTPRPGQVRTTPSRSSSANSGRSGGANGSGEWFTTRNDTLWKIASQTLPSNDVSVEQNMLAIKRKNPNAFIRDNINLLKAGYVLRTPSASEAAAVSTGQAESLVAQDHESWRSGAPLPTSSASESQVADTQPADLKGQVDATAAATTDAPVSSGEGKLRIVAGEGDSAQGAKDTENAGQALAASAEEQDRLGREVEELNYKLDREAELAANQLEIKQRQLEVKDQEIAELQATVAQMREDMNKLPTAQGQNQNAATAAADAPWWKSPWVIGGGLGGLALLLGMGLLAARRRREEDVDDFMEAAEPTFVSDPDTEFEAPEDNNNTLLGAAGAAIAAGGVASTLADDGIDDEETQLLEVEADDDTVVFDELEFGDDAETEFADAESEFDDVSADAGTSDDAGQTSDVVGEADIYIAYGRYPQAISLLQGALDVDPDRHDVRVKMLQLYAETNEAASFNENMEILTNRCDDDDVLQAARELQETIEQDSMSDSDLDLDTTATGAAATGAAAAGVAAMGAMGSSAMDSAADDALDATSFDEDLDAQADLDTDEFELELDDGSVANEEDIQALEAELDELEGLANDLDSSDTALDEIGDEIGEELDTDLDTDLGELADDSLADATEQLGGDLGMDFDPEVDVETDLDDEIPALNDTVDVVNADSDTQEIPANESFTNTDANTDTGAAAEEAFADDEFDFSDAADSASTKLDLARAYIDMGDEDGARDILSEVLAEGNDEQQKQASELLEGI